MSLKEFLLPILAGTVLSSAFSTAALANASNDDTHDGLIQYPSISPDAEHIVFSAAGDLWSVSATGGSATRLTIHPGIETQSRFNHEGDGVVFESNRNGAQNLYTLDLAKANNTLVAGDITRITTSDRAEMLGDLSPDGQSVVFSAFLYPEIYRQPRMYQVPLDGGPMTSVTEAFGRAPAINDANEDIYFVRGYYNPHRVAYRGPGNLDIWRLRQSDNSFVQVTQFAGNDMNPCPLPDGSLVYLSSRDGQYNLVRLAPDATDQQANSITQLTHFKPDSKNPTTISHGVRDLTISNDGSTAVFVVWNTLYTLDLTNARAVPMPVELSFGSESPRDRIEKKNISRNVAQAAMHPSGKSIAQITRGELFIRSTEEGYPTRRITDSSVRERDIAWSPDGVTLYFAADDEDSLGSIYAATVALATEDLNPPEPEPEVEETVEEPTDEAVVETDEEAAADESTEGSTEGSEEDTTEEPEEEKIDHAKRWATALRFDITPVIKSEALAFSPKPSPDGTKLMYIRDRGDIVIHDFATGEDRVIRELWSDPDLLWASDSRHIVFAATDLDFNTDIFLLDTQLNEAGELPEAVNISRHPDIDHSPALSHDGKVLTFLSDRDNENWQFDVYRVNLDRELDGMTSYELEAYYKDAIAAAKKLKMLDPVTFDDEESEETNEAEDSKEESNDEPEALAFDESDLDSAYLRVRRLTSTPQAESGLVMTPAADRIAFSTVIDTTRAYVSIDHKGKDRKTIKSGSVGDPRISLDGKSLTYVSGGQASKTSPTGGSAKAYPLDAAIMLDRQKELAQKFDEAAGRFGLSFYHPTMKGHDWNAMTDRYREIVMQTRTNQAFLRLMNLMWGEVDGSHTGTWGGEGFSASSPANGYFGINFTPVANGYRIDAIIEGGPISKTKNAPGVGDVITAIGDTELSTDSTKAGLIDLHTALAGTIGDELLVTYESSTDTDEDTGEPSTRMVLIKPTSYSAMSVLRYNDEVAKRRAQVDEMSDGKLGYLHIRSMGIASVRDYERDLFAAADGKDGLIIDVRDNGGGWTTDILLASLTAPNHAYTIPRGANPDLVRKDNYPRDRRLIYAYSRPINVLINQHSFSNAEIFAHSIKTAERGTIIGTQTFGGVISTGSFSLIDGTTVRRPFRGWYLPDGTDMESNGTMPDIDVPQTPADEVAGNDPQLEAAINELLGRTGD